MDRRELTLPDGESRHLSQVMRASVGQTIELFDGAGQIGRAIVTTLQKRVVRVELDQATLVHTPPPLPHVRVFTGVPKGERFRWLIEKATEIGIAELIPLKTERSVVLPRESRLEKQQQYVIEACKQAGRNQLMQVGGLTEFSTAVDQASTDSENIVFGAVPGATWNDSGNNDGSLPKLDPAVARVSLFVGPEGGFTSAEIDALRAVAGIAISAGPFVQRTETAVITLAAVVQQWYRAGGSL